LNRIYKILQYLSLDVAIGSIGSSILAVKVFDVRLTAFYWLILPVCVWIIYTSDHLLDALKVKNQATMGRHYFHYLHLKYLSVFLVLSIIFSIILIFQHLDRKTIIYGLILCYLIISYLLLNHFISEIFRFFPREFVIAIGYIAGTWGIPILLKYPFITMSQILILISYFLIILSIPLLYSIYEYKSDLVNGFISYSTVFGIKIAEYSIFVILGLSLILSAYSFIIIHQYCYLIILFMGFTLFWEVLFRKRLFLNEMYRIISDSMNFLPFILLI
jgi:hypothetical protein